MAAVEVDRPLTDETYLGHWIPGGSAQTMHWYELARLDATGTRVAWGTTAKPPGYDQAVEQLRTLGGEWR